MSSRESGSHMWFTSKPSADLCFAWPTGGVHSTKFNCIQPDRDLSALWCGRDSSHHLWLTRRTVASCKAYLSKSVAINEPFGLNTLDKDQGGWGSSPVELFTRGQRTSALFSLEPPKPREGLECFLSKILKCVPDGKFWLCSNTKIHNTLQILVLNGFFFFICLNSVDYDLNIVVLLLMFKRFHSVCVCLQFEGSLGMFKCS